jgi:hypothetical protein
MEKTRAVYFSIIELIKMFRRTANTSLSESKYACERFLECYFIEKDEDKCAYGFDKIDIVNFVQYAGVFTSRFSVDGLTLRPVQPQVLTNEEVRAIIEGRA